MKIFGYEIKKIGEAEEQKKESSQKQKQAAKNATKARSSKAKAKIENAVNLLRFENKAITMYSVQKVSKCSINTVKKYRDFIELQNKS